MRQIARTLRSLIFNSAEYSPTLIKITGHMLSQSFLKENFYYCEESGAFTRKSDNYHPKRPDPSNGYYRIRISGKLYYVHRLIWMYQTGSLPSGEIEHIDRNRANNKWSNLISVKKSINALNKTKLSNNKSGITGVYWDKDNKKWRAEVQIFGKKHKLGRFECIDDAKIACINKRRELGFSLSHGE